MERIGIVRKCWLAASALASVLGAGSAGAQGTWYNAAWPYRRAVTVPIRPASRLPGDEVAVVTMPTGGLTRPDGGDIRVTTQAGAEVSRRVLMTGPGDQATVAFARRSGVSTYYVYFGNRAADPPANELDIRRGVLMEVYGYTRPVAQSLQQVRAKLAEAPELIGRGFRPRIFQGHNPFSGDNRILVVYTGFLRCPWSGQYVFCSSSRDASFLLIDDQLVVGNPNRHGPQRDVRMQGSIELTSGLHKVTFLHACWSGDPVAVAAWRPPGQERIRPIPSSAFAEVVEARPGAMEERFKAMTADFIPVHAGEAFMKDFYIQRYTFEALLDGRPAQQARFEWDFGDGQTSTERRVDHVYLTDGEYVVALTVRAPSGRYTRTNRLVVSRPWDRVTDSALDSLQQYAATVSGYDFAALSDKSIAVACQLFERTGQDRRIVRAAQALLSRDKVAVQPLQTVVLMYADILASAGRDAEAAQAMLRASRLADSRLVRAHLMLRAGQRFARAPGCDEQAMEIFQEIISTFTSPNLAGLARLARVGIGDVWRVRGDYAKAQAAYAEAGLAAGRSGGDEAIIRGDMTRHVEAYLRGEDHDAADDYLQRWAAELPMDMLGGYWSLLQAKVSLARSRYRDAIEEVNVLLGVNPASVYAPELLMVGAEAHERMGHTAAARAALRRLADEYPESQLAAEAAAKLKGR